MPRLAGHSKIVGFEWSKLGGIPLKSSKNSASFSRRMRVPESTHSGGGSGGCSGGFQGVFWGRSWASSGSKLAKLGSKFSKNFELESGQKSWSTWAKKMAKVSQLFRKNFAKFLAKKSGRKLGKKSEIFFGKLGIFFKNF